MSRIIRHATLVAALLVTARPATAASGLASVQLVQNGQPGIAGLNDPRGVAAAPDGAHVYVNGFQDDDVVAFGRDPVTGMLTFIEREQDDVAGVTHMRGPTGIVVSPDGKHVYIATTEDAVVVFSRNPTLGILTFVTSYKDGEDGVQGLEDASAITISADGLHVYATGETEDAVAVFSRNATTGELTFVEREREGDGGVSGLRGASALALSPDGLFLYVTGRLDDTVVTFARNPVTGALAFLGKVVDDVASVDGLAHPGGVAVSPDGSHLYVAGAGDNAVAAFARNPVTGALTYLAIVPGYEGAFAVAVAPGGADVYVASRELVSVLGRNSGTGLLTPRNDEHVGASGGLGVTADGTHVYATSGGSRGVRGFRPTTLTCSATPLPACLAPASRKAKLFIKRNLIVPSSNTFAWRWQAQSGSDVSQYGNPDASTNDFVLCLYDQSASPQPRLSAMVPAGGACGFKLCWKALGSGFRYADTERQPDGLGKFSVKAVNGIGRIRTKGKGAALPVPSLPLPTPVRVQLQAANGVCWDTTFSDPTLNLPTKFKARGD